MRCRVWRKRRGWRRAFWGSGTGIDGYFCGGREGRGKGDLGMGRGELSLDEVWGW